MKISSALECRLPRRVFPGIILAIGAFALLALCLHALGESLPHVLWVMLEASFGSGDALLYTLTFATPLLFAALSTAIPLELGLLNIGVEGQLSLSALTAFATAKLATPVLPPFATWTLCLLVAIATGASMACFTTFLKQRYRIHEILSGLLLNFIALGLSSFFILGPLKNPDTQASETSWIHTSLQFHPVAFEIPLSTILAMLLAFLIPWIYSKSWWGWRSQWIGFNPRAATLAGIQVVRRRYSSMALSGTLAAFIGFFEVFGHSYRVIDGFSPQYGFTGFAIALLSGMKGYRLFALALFFSFLQKGALALELETEHMSKDFALIVQSLLLMAVSLSRKGNRS